MTRHRLLPILTLVFIFTLASIDYVVADDSRTGAISHMGTDAYGVEYLALPETGARLTVRICGPAACRTMRQTDVGPDQRVHPDRIADVSPTRFRELCGVPASAGLCRGSWSVVPALTLPPTDTETLP